MQETDTLTADEHHKCAKLGVREHHIRIAEELLGAEVNHVEIVDALVSEGLSDGGAALAISLARKVRNHTEEV